MKTPRAAKALKTEPAKSAVSVLRCAKTGRVLAIDLAPDDGSVHLLARMLSRIPGVGPIKVDKFDGSIDPAERNLELEPAVRGSPTSRTTTRPSSSQVVHRSV